VTAPGEIGSLIFDFDYASTVTPPAPFNIEQDRDGFNINDMLPTLAFLEVFLIIYN